MRYCPSLTCPHRLRTGAPAELFDHVPRCSDCGARLVASEDDAVAGRPAVSRDPYRWGARREDAAAVSLRRPGDNAQGVALVLGGLVLSALTYAFASRAHGTWMVAWGPVLYGVFLLVRGGGRVSGHPTPGKE